jgi:GT2 family glycosyltransferase
MLSVILATWNGEETVGAQLEALARQSAQRPWELLVADNGSADGTLRVVETFRGRIPGLRVIEAAARRGQAAACNIAAPLAAGTALAFCDQDDVVLEGWVEAMAAALEHYPLVAGVIRFMDDDSWQLRPDRLGQGPGGAPQAASDVFGFLPYGLTANLGVSREAFETVGGFDESLLTEDVDFCWRVQLAGFPMHVEPAAVVLKRRRRGVVEAWRQHYRYGLAHPMLFRKFRPYGMPRHLGRAFRRYAWLVRHAGDALHPQRRGVWVRVAAGLVGRVVGSVRARQLYL